MAKVDKSMNIMEILQLDEGCAPIFMEAGMGCLIVRQHILRIWSRLVPFMESMPINWRISLTSIWIRKQANA